MDLVADWTARIAERVAPNETDFAAEVGQAYAAGGKARAALFPKPGAEPGGFGLTALIGDLPVILRALGDSAQSLRNLLGGQELGNVIAIVSLGVAMRRPKSEPREPDGERPAPDPQPETAELRAAIRNVRERLENDGMPPLTAEPVTYELLAELLSDPGSAGEFLRRINGE